MNNSNRQCCCPMKYEEEVIPKYKIVGATISKASRGLRLAALGLVFVVVGVILIAMVKSSPIPGVGLAIILSLIHI